MSKKNLQQNISNKSGQSSSGNSGSSVPAYTGMTEELYTSLRQKGYTQDQIKKAYSGTPKMTEDLYKSLRQKGYTQEQIKSGQFDREFLIPWRTAGSANKSITEWGKIANDFSAWSGGLSNDWNDWDLDTANSWLETLRKNAQQARTIMQDLARQGLTSGSEEFDTYQSYYDYFSKAARSLANNNNSYVGYRDANMYQGSDGNYYSYDDVLKMEEGLKNDVAGMNFWSGIGWESDASTMGGHIVFNYDPEEKKEKSSELERMGAWLGEQNEKRDMADWYAENFTPDTDTLKFYEDAGTRLEDLRRQKEEAEKTRPDLQRQYAISDELGNVYDYDYDAYNRDVQKWNDEHSVLFEDLAAAERDYKYASDPNFRFYSAVKNASIDSPEVQQIIEQGKVRDGTAARYDSTKIGTGGSEPLTFERWFELFARGMGGNSAAGTGAGMPIADINANMGAAYEGSKHADIGTWSEDKLNAYFYLRGIGDDAGADRLAQLTNDAIAAAGIQKEIYEPLDQWQGEHPLLGGAVGTVAGVVLPMYLGIPEYLTMADMYLVTGGDIDKNAFSLMPNEIANRMVGNTANRLNKIGSLDDVTPIHLPVIGDKGLGDAYQLAISIAQSALSRNMAGGVMAGDSSLVKNGVQAFTLTQFFGSAASSGIMQGLERGLDPNKAFLLGTMNGVAEAVGEVVSLDKLVSIKGSAGMRNVLKDVLVQMGIEGSEEAFTTVMNTMADMIVNGDKNELEVAVQSYMSQGKSRAEAEKLALKDWLNGLAFDFVGGALSGGVSATGANISRNVGQYKDSTRYLIDLANQTAEGSKSREMLPKIENEFTRKQGRKKPRNISAFHGNQFEEQVKQDLISQNTGTAVRAIENRLAEMGETGDLHQKAQVMADYLISEMSGDNEVGFGLKISDQISANATANMRQVMGELQQARENFSSADYALQNEAWTDEVMKGRFLDASVLQGNRYATADYQFGRSMEKNLTQMADLEQQISEARAELETLSPADTERKAELRNVIQEAETKLNEARTRQNAVLQDKYDSYSETDKNASVQIDGQEYKVSGLTKDGDVKLTGADGVTTTVSADDDRLPSAFRSLALKTKALGWASSAAFDYYKPGTDINSYIARIQNIRAIASEKIGRDAFMDSAVVKALNNAPLAEFLYNHGQELYNSRQQAFQEKLKETQKKITEAKKAAKAKTGSETGRVKGPGKVDTVSGFDVNGKHFEGIRGMKLSKTQQAVVDMVNSLADTLNINYVIYNGEASGVNGAYRDGADPIIAININAGKYSGGKLIRALAAETLSHELTHFIEHFAEEEYASLRDAVVDVMFNKDSDAFARRVQNAERLLPENFKGDRNDAAVREVVADACTQMLKNSEMVTEIARQNMTAAQKVKDFIDQTVVKIRNAIAAAFADSDPEFYRQEAKLILDEAERIQKLWDDGLKAATENYNAVQTAEEGAGVQLQTSDAVAQAAEGTTDQYQTARDDYNESVRIDNRIEEINDELAAIQLETDPSSKEKRRRLENELVKLEYDAEQLANKERSLTRKTSINELLENLDDYRPNDLISLANQLTDSNWDGVEDMQSDELREELRQMLEERAEDLTELERQAPKYGLFVRPVDRTYSAPAKSSSNNIVQFPGAQQDQFQMASDIEETDRLIAVHNKSVSGLKRMLQRGGVPFPSIAIKKAGTSHEGFGDVSIVFPRSTIDPQVNRQNRLYSNDAWTPTEPRTEYDVGDMWRYTKALQKELGSEIYNGLRGNTRLDEDAVRKSLENNKGDVFDALKNVALLRYAYLNSIGQTPEIQYKEDSLDGSYKYKNEQLTYLFDNLSEDEINALSFDNTEGLQAVADLLNRQFMEQFSDSANGDLLKSLARKPLYTADSVNPHRIQDAYRNYVKNGNKTAQTIDFYATEDALNKNKAIDEDPGFRKWIEERFGDLVVDSGIRNDKDIFTPSGNRRSFKQLHVPATLDNIVREMQKQQEKGIGVFGTNLRGAATKQYNTIEEMRAESGKLLGERINDEVYDSIMSGFNNRLNEMVDRIVKSTNDISSWQQADSARESLLEAIRDAKSKARMKSMLQAEERWFPGISELADDLWDLRNDVQNMPAPYFEAKPRRVVYPEEALAYILPDNADSDVIKQLQDRNYNVMTYEAGNEEDRLAKVNSVDGAQFQMADRTADDTLFESDNRTAAWNGLKAENKILRESAERLAKEIENLTKRNDKLAREFKRTLTPEIRLNDAKKLAREIVRMTQRDPITTRDKQYNKEMSDELAERIKGVADYIIQTGENLDYDKVTEMAYEIAQDIVNNAEAEIDDGGATKEMREQMKAALKGKAIYVAPNVRADTLDWNAFKKAHRDIFTFREDGTPVDMVYESLLDEVPGLLDPNINNPGDMLNEMAEKWDLLQPKYENPYEQYENEAVSHFMNMIIESALDGTLRQVAPTYADKMNSRLAALREQRDAKVEAALAEGRERVSELRAQKNDRIEEVRREGIARKQEALAKERETKWAKVAEAEAIGRERVAALRAQKNEKIDRVYREGLKSKQEAVARERAAKWAKEAAAKQEGRERLEELRADKNERIEAVRKYYQEMRERSAIRRANGDTRTRIKKLVADLNTRLTHPTEKRYVPAHLVKNTIDILEMIDLDSGRGGVKLAEKIALLQQQYAQLKNDKSFQGYAYDSVIEAAITKMAQVVGDTPLRKMNAQQLETVLTTLQELEHVIRTSIKQRIHGENVNLYESGRNAIKATNGVGDKSSNILGNAADWYTSNTMRPDVVFDRFGGFAKDSEWVRLFNMLNNAQRYGMDLQMKFAKPFEDLLKDKKNLAKLTSAKDADLVDIGLKDENGETIRITRDFMLFVYMNLFNEDNIRHVMFGGITVPELKEYLAGKGDRGFGKGHRKAVGISNRLAEINDAINNATDVTEKARLLEEKDTILKEGMEYIDRLRSSIESQLTDYDKKWVDAWWKFNDMASETLNETTMDVYGIKKFIVENYFPIITDKNYVDVPMETIIKDMSLENAGFTKERIHASTPLKMMGLADVINMQANRTAQYAAMMPAVRAFNRIWNTTLPGYSTSLRDTVNSKFGSNGVKFVENLISDLQGGRRGEFTIFDRLRGHMAQATLSLNPRVALAQTASFPTAAAELGWRPVMKALARGGKNDRMLSAADRELIAKWSSTLWFRTKGATADLADVKNMQQASHKVMDKLGWAMNWIEFMDGATVGRLWYAAEYYVEEHDPKLKRGTDAYYEKVAEAFNRCVERTQPNYTTLQRPELLRDPRGLVRALTMFMTQRLQNQSIMYGATMKYLKYRSDLASGKNGVTQADVREMRDRLVNAATSQIVAGMTIAIFKALCDGILHRWGKGYRDDDEQLTAESVGLEVLDIFAESIVSNVLGGSEIYSAVKSIITGDKYYGIELSGVSTFTDLISDVVSLAQKPSLKTAKKLGEAFAMFFGIPVANAEKIGQALWYWAEDAIKGEFMEAGIERTSAQNAKLLREAYAAGDEKKIEKYSAEFEDDDDKLDAVRQSIKDGYVSKNQTISKTEAVELLVKAGMRRKDAEAKVQEWTCEVVTGIPFSKIKEEFMKGNITQYRVVELLQKYGGRDKESAEKTARYYACEKETGYVYSDLKEAYLNDEISRDKLIPILKKYGLLSSDDAVKKADYFDYLKLMPDSKISEQRAAVFMKDIKKTGLSAKEYENMVLNVDADDSGGYSQKEVGSYIKKHNFTDAQISALWKAFGKTWKTDFWTWQVKVAADATGTGKSKNNGNVSQAELGYYLVDEIKAGRMTLAQAEKYWKSLLTTSKKDFQQWCKSKRIKFN